MTINMTLLKILGHIGLTQLNSPRIFYFHSFGTKKGDMRLSVFENIVKNFDRLGYKICSLDKLGFYKKKTISFTFDDGYKNNLEAIKILNKYGFSGTIFVCSDFINSPPIKQKTNLYKNREFLSEDDLIEITELGSEIASHGTNHSNFNHLTNEEIKYQLIESRKKIEKIINKNVNSFAFPNGQRGAFKPKYNYESSGYKYICTTIWGTFKSNKIIQNRCEVRATDNFTIIYTKLAGLFIHRWLYDRLTNRGNLWR
jgi:peptidoglycan/xylan/chitin deacetylase (PgdA/CDA1 family)